MEAIQFIGLNDLDKVDQAMVNKLATEYYDKFKRMLKNESSLRIHIKSYGKGGARDKYSVHVMLIAPTQTFESSKANQAAEFDLASCMHESFKNLERQLEHHFKGAQRGYKKEHE